MILISYFFLLSLILFHCVFLLALSLCLLHAVVGLTSDLDP